MQEELLKIVQVKSRYRVVLPREVTKALKLKEGDFVAFLKSSPGVRIRKVVFEIKEE